MYRKGVKHIGPSDPPHNPTNPEKNTEKSSLHWDLSSSPPSSEDKRNGKRKAANAINLRMTSRLPGVSDDPIRRAHLPPGATNNDRIPDTLVSLVLPVA